MGFLESFFIHFPRFLLEIWLFIFLLVETWFSKCNFFYLFFSFFLSVFFIFSCFCQARVIIHFYSHIIYFFFRSKSKIICKNSSKYKTTFIAFLLIVSLFFSCSMLIDISGSCVYYNIFSSLPSQFCNISRYNFISFPPSPLFFSILFPSVCTLVQRFFISAFISRLHVPVYMFVPTILFHSFNFIRYSSGFYFVSRCSVCFTVENSIDVHPSPFLIVVAFCETLPRFYVSSYLHHFFKPLIVKYSFKVRYKLSPIFSFFLFRRNNLFRLLANDSALTNGKNQLFPFVNF